MGPQVIIVPSLFLMIGYLFYVVVNGFTRRQQLKAVMEFQTKLLDLMELVQVVAGLAAAAVLLVWSLPSQMRALALLRG